MLKRQSRQLELWFRGLRKFRHALQAIVAHEVGRWPHNGWPEACGKAMGDRLTEFRKEDPENFDLVMNGPLSPNRPKESA